MYSVPLSSIDPMSADYETKPLIKPTGFREYDARWLFGSELNLMGVQALGAGIGTVIHDLGVEPRVVVGHDYRAYSASIKHALILGLMSSGCEVKDIGLALSPMAYYAQFALDCPAVAMVTASHNENGWTGVKMGANRPMTFGPDEMAMLRDVVLEGRQEMRPGGSLEIVQGFAERYIADLADRSQLAHPLKVVTACGNGTAGAFAPRVFRALGCEVIEMDCDLDHSFPNYNPNPEDMNMLHALRDRVLETGADVGLAFDGDGDRCGVVDEKGNEIFADKIGVMLARDLSAIHDNRQFVVDVKSTGLYHTDPVLQQNGAQTDYHKTGHSYIKRRVNELGALVGFEKSGHFFFNEPIGHGYDDGLVSGIAVCDMLDRNPGTPMSKLYEALPRTYGSPTMSAKCADEVKYQVVDKVIDRLSDMVESGGMLGGQTLIDANMVNGIRVTAKDGTWGLVRASSNKPELVVVVESPVSNQRLHDMFHALDGVLRQNPEVGAYNQTI